MLDALPSKMLLQVAKGLPTVVTIASKSPDVALRAQALLSTSRFRCYTSDDIQGGRLHLRAGNLRLPGLLDPSVCVKPLTTGVGVELGGALKNVLAIACGIRSVAYKVFLSQEHGSWQEWCVDLPFLQ